MIVDLFQVLLGLPERNQAVVAARSITEACEQFSVVVADQPPEFWAAMEEIPIVRQSESDSEWDQLQRSPAKRYRARVALWAAGVRATGQVANVRTEWARMLLSQRASAVVKP